MFLVLLWIVGCYALAAAAVHAAWLLTSKEERQERHYVLLAGNEQQQMEWYMRSLNHFSRYTGTEVKVTVVDGGSEDETMEIAGYFARDGMHVDMKSGASVTLAVSRAEATVDGALLKGKESPAIKDVQRSSNHSKWQRSRMGWGHKQRILDHADHITSTEPTHLLWKLQAEGIITPTEQAVIIDLRDPADLSKLPL